MTGIRTSPTPDDQGERQFIAQARDELDQSCRALDGATVSRLNAIRHQALARHDAPRRKAMFLPFGGLATACVLVVAVVLLEPGSTPFQSGVDDSAPVEDLDILTSADSLELFMDYEFYHWLAENN